MAEISNYNYNIYQYMVVCVCVAIGDRALDKHTCLYVSLGRHLIASISNWLIAETY